MQMNREEFINRFSACLVYALWSKKETADQVAANIFDQEYPILDPEKAARKYIKSILKLVNQKANPAGYIFGLTADGFHLTPVLTAGKPDDDEYPSVPGLYELTCMESDYKPDYVAITAGDDCLMVHCHHLGKMEMKVYFDNLTNLNWKKIA